MMNRNHLVLLEFKLDLETKARKKLIFNPHLTQMLGSFQLTTQIQSNLERHLLRFSCQRKMYQSLKIMASFQKNLNQKRALIEPKNHLKSFRLEPNLPMP